MTKPTLKEIDQRPTRAGVFPTLQGADEAVRRLLAAGFSKDEITVVCSDETKERYFREFEHQDPAGAHTPKAAAIGGSIGATAGGLAAGAVGLALGGLPLIVTAGIGVMAGGVWGGFLGAMATRGGEKEAANYYDQAVVAGKLLVAVECHGPDQEERLALADRILVDAGAETEVPLPEG
jgi:hypothetical protein